MEHIVVGKEISQKKQSIANGGLSIYIIASIVGGLNVLFSTSYILSMGLIVTELFILAYFFMKKDITRYLGFYLIFLCLSLEFEVLVGSGNLYGFKNFRIMGLNLGIITLLPVATMMFLKKIKISKIKELYPGYSLFSKIFFSLSFAGIFFGLVQILINDNGLYTLGNPLKIFISIMYNTAAIPILIIISFAYLILYENDKWELLESFMLAVLVGVVISMMVSLASGTFGRYGGVNILLVSNNHFYIPFMLYLPFYNKYNNRRDAKLIFWLGVIGAVLVLIFNSSGKAIILYGMIPIILLYISIKKRKWLSVLSLLAMVPIAVLLLSYLSDSIILPSIILNSKLNEVRSLLSFWESDWLQNMSLSPRIRVAEFLNTFIEYMKKPWFLLGGKGYMGTFIDHSGVITSRYVPGAFTENQWNQGVFYAVHESFNVLFLYNGISGLLFYGFMLRETFKKMGNCIWMLIGGVWFTLVFGYSVTMSAYGVTSLLLGLIYFDRSKMMKEKEL